MMEIALLHNVNHVSLKTLSANQNISLKFSEQIVRSLCRNGLLRSVRGSRGGYMLTKDPAKYTIGEILRITENSLISIDELAIGPLQKTSAYDSVTANFFRGLNEVIDRYVDSITLDDLAQVYQEQAANDYVI